MITSALYQKSPRMLKVIFRFLRRFAYRINTKWAWFFTNGNKAPREAEYPLFPEEV